jgi:hypothetical protein
MSREELKKCAEACLACSLACDYCVSSLLKSEKTEKLKDCIKTLLECTAICKATVAVISLEGTFSEQQCRLSIDACNRSAEVCEANMQAEPEHCRACADACRQCADICEETFNVMSQPVLQGNSQQTAPRK